MGFITRAYNRFEINSHEATITKFSKEQRLCNEIEHYKKTPIPLRLYFPKFICSDFNEETKEHSLRLELCGYDNLGSKLVRELGNGADWETVAFQLKYILEQFSRFQRPRSSIVDLQSMYENKTYTEYVKLISGFDRFTRLSKHAALIIDGKQYKNFEYIWDDIEKLLESYYNNTKFCFFHGDMCFSNILYGFLPDDRSKVILKLIDMRGKFGTEVSFGDPYYDLAKLMHSTDVGYEYFIYDKFSVVDNGSNFEINYANQNKKLVNEIFTDILYSNYDIKKIKTIQGLIYVGMCARHYDSPQRQLAMYLSGVKILNEVLEE
jgi:hypothetical protein